MSRKTTLLGLVFLIFMAAGYFLLFDGEKTALQTPKPSLLLGESRLTLPPAEEVKAAVAPHDGDEDDEQVTPQGVLEFAHRLTGIMEPAMDSEEAAGPVFTQLENCATDTQKRQVVRARLICFANASRLAQQWPDSIGPRFKVLAGRTPKLASMLETTGL